MRHFERCRTILLPLGLMAAVAVAQDPAQPTPGDGDGMDGTGKDNANLTDPREAPVDTWITLSGTVQSVSRDRFILDYGKDTISVEMDDGDRDADGYKLLEGDKVTVAGKVDRDLYTRRTIEASSIYVEKLNTYFHASAVDEAGLAGAMTLPVSVSQALIQGKVTQVGENQFTVSTGASRIQVETDALPHDPLDGEGYQTIEKGDIVSVRGRMNEAFLEDGVLVADFVTTLRGS